MKSGARSFYNLVTIMFVGLTVAVGATVLAIATDTIETFWLRPKDNSVIPTLFKPPVVWVPTAIPSATHLPTEMPEPATPPPPAPDRQDTSIQLAETLPSDASPTNTSTLPPAPTSTPAPRAPVPFTPVPPTWTATPTPSLTPVVFQSQPVITHAPLEPVPGQVVIRFAPGTSPQQRAAYITSIGGEATRKIDALNTVVVNVPQAIASQPLPDSPVIEASEPDYFVTALDDPPAIPYNDPLYPDQWALPVIGAPDAWEALPPDAPTITVAVIDSGICAEHPDLTGRIGDGWDFLENDPVPQDDFGHGCAVAGVIAANPNNGVGIIGVAPNAQIMPLRVLNAQGVGTYSDVAAAIVYAADNGAEIVNLSLGGSSPSGILEDAVNYATSRGVMVIAAAGNTGQEGVLYPAAYEPVIAVASVDPDLQRSSFSSYGPEVDLLAPGRDIVTTQNGGSYGLMNGTSFAAPHVAGIAVLETVYGRTLVVNGGLVSVNGTPVVVPMATPTETMSPTLELTVAVAPDNYGTLLSNSLFLYSPSVLNFDVQTFLDNQPGPLKNYTEEIDNQTWTAAEVIRFNAIFFGVNPQFILVVLDAQSNLVSNAQAEVAPGFYGRVRHIAEWALVSFDRRRYHQSDAQVVLGASHFCGRGGRLSISRDRREADAVE